MHIFGRIDKWMAKEIFFPIVIPICRVTHQTQYAVSKQLMFASALSGIYNSPSGVITAIWVMVALLYMLYAVINADQPGYISKISRAIFFMLFALDLSAGIIFNHWAGIEMWILALASEYANLIKTIPPKEKQKQKNLKTKYQN